MSDNPVIKKLRMKWSLGIPPEEIFITRAYEGFSSERKAGPEVGDFKAKDNTAVSEEGYPYFVAASIEALYEKAHIAEDDYVFVYELKKVLKSKVKLDPYIE